MSKVEITHGENEKTVVENPEFIDTLCNTEKAAVDGTIYTDVTQVTFMGENDE